MNPTIRRASRAATVALALAAQATVAGSAAAVTPRLAAFDGSFRSDCDLPTEAGTGEPTSGAYTCGHSAASTFCEYVIPPGPVSGHHETCEAHLLDGYTSGSVEYDDAGGYRCVNGLGTGTVEYVQDNSGPPVYIPVLLQVHGAVITITGSYIRAGTDELIDYRATIPAQCTTRTRQPAGYAGTVTPI